MNWWKQRKPFHKFLIITICMLLLVLLLIQVLTPLASSFWAEGVYLSFTADDGRLLTLEDKYGTVLSYMREPEGASKSLSAIFQAMTYGGRSVIYQGTASEGGVYSFSDGSNVEARITAKPVIDGDAVTLGDAALTTAQLADITLMNQARAVVNTRRNIEKYGLWLTLLCSAVFVLSGAYFLCFFGRRAVAYTLSEKGLRMVNLLGCVLLLSALLMPPVLLILVL